MVVLCCVVLCEATDRMWRQQQLVIDTDMQNCSRPLVEPAQQNPCLQKTFVSPHPLRITCSDLNQAGSL